MKCPIDGAELVMTERQGVEIDYCPTCRGVWLDRGELDKILDRAVQTASAAAVPPPMPQPAPQPTPQAAQPRYDRPRESYRDDDRYRDQPRDQYGRPYKKRKESWLGEIFDF